MIKRLYYTTLCCLLFLIGAFGQADTSKPVPVDTLIKRSAEAENLRKIDSVRKAFVPKKATIRSAILPGWGQAYNKKYWKIPIVYGALGTTAGIFFYNLKTYRDLRFAYTAVYEANLPKYDPNNTTYLGPFRDSTKYRQADPRYIQLDQNSIKVYRDEYRRNIDYSVLFFLLFWGLNVVDATVDAHLKAFDVSPDLSFKFKIGPSQFARTTGLSLVLAFKDKRTPTALRPLP